MKEIEFREGLTKTMLSANFDLYRQAWEGWEEESNQRQNGNKKSDDGMGAFLSPLDKSMEYMQKVIDEELKKNIY